MNSTMREAVPLVIPTNLQYSNGVLTQIQEENSQGLKICEEGLEVLQKIGDNEVIVISIFGQARSGKSYLLSKLGGVRFKVSPLRHTETIGVWIGTFKLTSTNSTVILLDCEGTDSIMTHFYTGGFNSEQKILSLCYLLSSVIIYNCSGVTIKHSLNKLQHVINFINCTSSNNLNGFSKHSSPILWWLFRNSTLLHDDEDLWDSFKNDVFQNENLQIELQNVIDSIERGFCTVKTTTLRSPSIEPKICANLDLPQNQDKLKIFKKEISDFRDEIFSYAEIKSVGGLPLTGNRLAEFVNGPLKSLLRQLDFPRLDKLWDLHVDFIIIKEAETASKQLFANTLETIRLPLTKRTLERKFELTKEMAEMIFYRKARSAMGDSNWDAKGHFESLFERNMKSSLVDKAHANVIQSENLCFRSRDAQLTSLSEMAFPQDVFSEEGLQIMQSRKEMLLSTYDEETAGCESVDDIRTNLINRIDRKLFEVLKTKTKQNMSIHCNKFFLFYIGTRSDFLQEKEAELTQALQDLSVRVDDAVIIALSEELTTMVENKDKEVVRRLVLCAIVFSIITVLVLYKSGIISLICELGKTTLPKIAAWLNNALVKMITEVASRVFRFVTDQAASLIEKLIQGFITELMRSSDLANESLQLRAVGLMFRPTQQTQLAHV